MSTGSGIKRISRWRRDCTGSCLNVRNRARSLTGAWSAYTARQRRCALRNDAALFTMYKAFTTIYIA